MINPTANIGGVASTLSHTHTHTHAHARAPTLSLSQTEVGGEVVKILVDNGTPVTPGVPIMIIKP
jgi:multidrug efflux pump subunit AcrA (membrane-fusion protein)